MHTSTLTELLRCLLLPTILKGFLYIAGVDKPTKHNPYPNRGRILKHLLSCPRQHRILWDRTIVVLELVLLKWPHLRVLGPSICVRDDGDPIKLEQHYYVQKVLNVSGKPFQKVD